MNEKNTIKRIRQLKQQIKTLEEVEMDDTTRTELIERNRGLISYYTRKLKDLKWNWILGGNDIETILN